MRVFKKRVLRRIFGPRRNIIRAIKSRRLRWAAHVARMGETRDACRVLVKTPQRMRLLRRARRV
jgi:hypothetical protein